MLQVNQDHPCDGRNYQKGRTLPLRYLVIHYVGALGTAQENARYYGGSDVGASAHYFVGHGPEAEIYQSVAEGDTAWHCGTTKGYKHPECRNANSIGIEMCCRREATGRWSFDRETVERTAALAREIMARHGIPTERVLRHYDVTGKICPAPFVEDPGAWAAFLQGLTGAPVPGGADGKGETDMDEKEIRALIARVLAERDAAVAARGVSTWARAAWDTAVAEGVLDGTAPGGPLTREQYAVIRSRVTKGPEAG